MKPYIMGKWQSLPQMALFWIDPIKTLQRLHGRHGPFVRLDHPRSTSTQSRELNLIADAALYRQVLSDTETWRNVKVTPIYKGNAAADRVTTGMTRLRGARHEHYRKLIGPSLKRLAVAAMAPEMARIAQAQIRTWPRQTPVGLPQLCRDLAKHLAVGLLFGDNLKRALPITDMISRMVDVSWPVPTIAYFRWAREAEAQERAIVEWANEKRGRPEANDLLSILVNNTDEQGNPPGAELLGGLTSFIFAAAYDTCQNGLAWTLLLLTQFPEIMEALSEEVAGALSGGPATIVRVGSLPLLDSVVKESLRLLPPVPLMIRRAWAPAKLGSATVGCSGRAVVSAFLINRDPDIYPEPHRFDPDRWKGINPSPFQYPVFGAGGHMCPGVTFGLQMMKIGLAAILAESRVEMAPHNHVGYRTHITLAPHGRVEVIFRGRRDKGVHRPLAGPISDLLALENRMNGKLAA